MLLNRSDLEQMDEAYLKRLSPEQLLAVSARLLQDVKELHERLNQNARNSSEPPSRQPAYLESGALAPGEESSEKSGEEAPVEAKPEPGEGQEVGEAEPAREPAAAGEAQSGSPKPGEGESGARRAGKPVGAPGYGRTQILAPRETVDHRAEQCAACGAVLGDEAPFMPRLGFYQAELELGSVTQPGLQVVCTLHRYGETSCGCGHRTGTRPASGVEARPEGFESEATLSEWRLVGPLLASLLVCLAFRMRLSRPRIRELIQDWLQLELSVGVINQTLHEAGLAAAPVHEQLIDQAREAELQQVDETPWKEHGRVLWLWVFVSARVVVFVVGRRTRQVLQQVLTEAFTGWLMSDGHVNYRDYAKRLRCLAHLERKARGLAESLDADAKAFGEAALLMLAVVFKQVRDGPDQAIHQPFLALFKTFCELHWHARHEKTRALAREFLHDWEAIWAVLEHPDLPATNNAAERALRHWVIARLISHGTRTPQGSRVFAILASVIDTCRLRGLSPWTYLASVIAERRQGRVAPELPATA
jgi:transposase